MVKLNGDEVKWDKAPNFVNNIQRKILWWDDKTGAIFALMKIPKGTLVEDLPHNHPKSGQITFHMSGEAEFPDGTTMSIPEDEYRFSYCPPVETMVTFSPSLYETISDKSLTKSPVFGTIFLLHDNTFSVK